MKALSKIIQLRQKTHNLFTFYLLSQLVKIKTWELRPILELSPILELKPPSDVEIFIKARALITVNTVMGFY